MQNCFKDLFADFDAIVFFDTETSGLDPEKEQIIEIAAVCIENSGRTTTMDEFISLPDGKTLPPEIVELTHITDEMLKSEGISPAEASQRFFEIIEGKNRKKVLLAAHNAQFDLMFTRRFLKGKRFSVELSFLDTVTVYKDRAPYPHKLETAIEHYKLEDSVQNSHRAIDDVLALVEVACAMARERSDLHSYVNLFGYNPKYGEPTEKIRGVTYRPQSFTNFMRWEEDTLPRKNMMPVQNRTGIFFYTLG